ncbi:MAG: 1,4-alpha-glucan branching protein GlgB [Puniceicoccales bacterium]|jgi:1,4-alpha-glucan branching enzyme|nr:1,4-alpha-glucan branching protein GlgB [Puniceicoccales bacterium]
MISRSQELQLLVEARLAQPHHYLGLHEIQAHEKSSGMVIRAYLHNAKNCTLLGPGWEIAMAQLHPSGIFEAFIPDIQQPFLYQFRIDDFQGHTRIAHDPYRFLPTLSADDLHLFNEGKHHHIHHKLGAHRDKIQGIWGTRFAVWAPNAQRVSVVGNFNAWDGRYHPMRLLGNSGIWELFIPHLESGEFYKFELLGADRRLRLKTDPYGSHFEAPPHNTAIVPTPDSFPWQDSSWMQNRAHKDPQKQCISIYEMHFDSWRHHVEADYSRPYSYREIAPILCKYLQKMHFTHVEFMPLNEFPFLGSWGYQVTGFFAPTQRYGNPDDFKYLIDALHQQGIGVLLDWVPGHFPKDEFSLATFDGTCLYEHEDPRQGEHKEWGTLVFNYGRHEVRNFLMGSAINWCDHFHIDGLRIDAVASMLYHDYCRPSDEWIPNCYGGKENIEAISFLRELNDVLHEMFPGVMTIAEEATSFSGVTAPTRHHGLGFDFKWNMGWMHDTLRYFSYDPLFRRYHHHQLTFGMLYQYSEHFIHAFSHDEMVYGKRSLLQKMPGDSIHQKSKELRSLFGFMWAWPGKKTLFMGGEFGQSNEWNYQQSLDWHLLAYDDHSGIQRLIIDLNTLYKKFSFLSLYDSDPCGFQWILCDDFDHSVFAFLRKGTTTEECLLVVCNFTPVTHEHYRIGVPLQGTWQCILHTDAPHYGGNELSIAMEYVTENIPCHGQDHSLVLTLFGTSVAFFRPMV